MDDSTCSLLLTKYVKQQMMFEGCLALCCGYQEGMMGKLHLIKLNADFDSDGESK